MTEIMTQPLFVNMMLIWLNTLLQSQANFSQLRLF